jgi:hypothetical protein
MRAANRPKLRIRTIIYDVAAREINATTGYILYLVNKHRKINYTI